MATCKHSPDETTTTPTSSSSQSNGDDSVSDDTLSFLCDEMDSASLPRINVLTSQSIQDTVPTRQYTKDLSTYKPNQTELPRPTILRKATAFDTAIMLLDQFGESTANSSDKLKPNQAVGKQTNQTDPSKPV